MQGLGFRRCTVGISRVGFRKVGCRGLRSRILGFRVEDPELFKVPGVLVGFTMVEYVSFKRRWRECLQGSEPEQETGGSPNRP